MSIETPEQIADRAMLALGFCDVTTDLDRQRALHIAVALATAVRVERERCAAIAHNMARSLISKRGRINKAERFTSDLLVQCRDKITDAYQQVINPTEKL